jgi:phage baseplate assembly protein W
MDAATLFGQGISFPPRLGADGRIAWSSGPDNIREMIRVTLLTQPGERVMLSGFGGKLRPFLFSPNTVATRQRIQEEIETALSLWEPRIDVLSVSVTPDADDARTAVATLQYELVASQTLEQLQLTVQLGG